MLLYVRNPKKPSPITVCRCRAHEETGLSSHLNPHGEAVAVVSFHGNRERVSHLTRQKRENGLPCDGDAAAADGRGDGPSALRRRRTLGFLLPPHFVEASHPPLLDRL